MNSGRVITRAFASITLPLVSVALLSAGEGCAESNFSSLSSTPLRYHDEAEVTAWMKSLPARAPGITQYKVIGTSFEGREIGVISIGDDVTRVGSRKPSIVINATHHGDEKIGTESSLHLIETLIEERDRPEIARMLAHYVFHVQPIVNPDGHFLGTRLDSRQRDINRDYAYPGRPDRRAFKTPEARAVRDLIDGEDVQAAIALHSGTEGVLWPWCHTREAPPDAPFLTRLAWRTARSLGTTARQSWHDYPSAGEFTDFVYWRQKAPALTIEVDRRHMPHPSQINTISARTTKGILAFVGELMKSSESRDIAANH